MKSIKRTTYALWSGGLDSTAMIDRLLQENSEETVIAGYIKIVNNCDKTTMEMDRTRKIASIFSGKYGHRFTYKDCVVETDILSPHASRLLFNQIPVWIFGMLMSLPREVDRIAIGYIMNDDAVSFLDDIKRVWASYKPFVSGKMPPLIFPMAKTKKEEAYDGLSDDIRQLIWTCETPRLKGTYVDLTGADKFEPCGRCASCQRAIGGQIRDVPKEYGSISDSPAKNVSVSECHPCAAIEVEMPSWKGVETICCTSTQVGV